MSTPQLSLLYCWQPIYDKWTPGLRQTFAKYTYRILWGYTGIIYSRQLFNYSINFCNISVLNGQKCFGFCFEILYFSIISIKIVVVYDNTIDWGISYMLICSYQFKYTSTPIIVLQFGVFTFIVKLITWSVVHKVLWDILLDKTACNLGVEYGRSMIRKLNL